MALTNTSIPNAASDVVGIFGQGFSQVFPLAKPIKLIADETAKAFEHPVEDGVVITDHIIFQPNEIEIAFILPQNNYRSVFQQMDQIFRAATVLSVQCRATTYTNMYIYKKPHTEDTDLFNTIAVVLRLRQIIKAAGGQALPATSVENPVDQSTINNGLQQPGTTTALPSPDSFKSIYQGLPPSESPFLDPSAPGFNLKLPPGVQGPAPNAAGYASYKDDLPPDINTGNYTFDQLTQVLTAKSSSNSRAYGPGF